MVIKTAPFPKGYPWQKKEQGYVHQIAEKFIRYTF